MGKREKIVPAAGQVIKVPLENGHTYGQVLADTCIAFYNIYINGEISLDRVVECPVLFIVAVDDRSIRNGSWPLIGVAPYSARISVPNFFVQDILDPNSFEIYHSGSIRRATREECLTLERASVWDQASIRQRLMDTFASRENEIFRSQRIIGE